MAAGRGAPVDGAVVVAVDVAFDLLEVGVVADTADALDAHLGDVVAHGQQLILPQHHIARIDLHVDGLAEREAPLGEAEAGADEDAHAAKAVDAALRGRQLIADGGLAPGAEVGSEQDVAPLEDDGDLVDRLRRDGKGIVALEPDADGVGIAVGEAVGQGAPAPDALLAAP